MRFVFLFLITMLFVLPAYAQAPFCQIGRDNAPVIDGVFDEPQWQECAHIFPFSENMGTGMAAAQIKDLSRGRPNRETASLKV